MSRSSFRRLLILSSCAVACATAPRHDFEIADQWRGAPDVGRALLAPMNATGMVADELQAGARRTFAAVRAHLEAHQIAVETISLYRFRDAWMRSFENVDLDPADGPSVVPAEAIAAFMEILEVDREFDVLIMPWIVMRETRLSGYRARWDGVSRRVPNESGSLIRWTGNPAAASLHVLVYAETGDLVFEGLGGLDMLFKYTGGTEVKLVDDPLSDLENILEGVRIAFDPFIPFGR